MKKISVTDLRLYTQGSEKEKNEFISVFGKSIQEFGFVVIEGHNISNTFIENCYQ
jgi:isopenicillin N synthase-like dioxygenase